MSVYGILNTNFWEMYWALPWSWVTGSKWHPTTASRTALDGLENEASDSTFLPSPKKATFNAILDMMKEATGGNRG